MAASKLLDFAQGISLFLRRIKAKAKAGPLRRAARLKQSALNALPHGGKYLGFAQSYKLKIALIAINEQFRL
jgi:hypothetical protein